MSNGVAIDEVHRLISRQISSIENAKDEVTATAISTDVQYSTMRLLIDAVDDLKKVVRSFGADSTYWSRLLAWLTGALIVLTGVLTWLTWELVKKAG